LGTKYNLLKRAIEVYNLKPTGQTFKNKEIEDFFYPSRWEM